jgi:O-antigen ligase
MAVGGSITAASQIVTFLFAQRGVNVWALLGIQAFDTGDVYFGVNSTVIDLYRDLGITMNFAVLGALLLTATIMRRRLLFSWQCSLFLLGVCLAGIALSLTRTVWVALLVGLIVLFVRSGVSARTLLTLGIPILMIVTATSVIGARVFDLPVESTLERRLATFGDLPNQKSLEYRFNETQSALDHLGDNWFTGVGAVVVSVNEAGVIFQRNQLHNGFVHVLVAGGIFSVGSLCLVLGVGFSAAWRRSSRGESKDERLLGLALCASLGAMVVIAFVGGVWNDAFQTPIVGLILGLVVSPTEDRTAASESASEADRRPSPRS